MAGVGWIQRDRCEVYSPQGRKRVHAAERTENIVQAVESMIDKNTTNSTSEALSICKKLAGRVFCRMRYMIYRQERAGGR